MTDTARDLLQKFDALPPAEQQSLANEIVCRSTSVQNLTDAALDELAAELFLSYEAEEASRPTPDRGEIWLVDLRNTALSRPALVLSVRTQPLDRAPVTVVPYTASAQGTRFEVFLPKPFLSAGVFDVQGLVTVARQRLLRRIGVLERSELATIQETVKNWLGC